MGGMGSGRTGGNPTDETTVSFILSVKGLLGRLPWSAVGSGTVTFRSRWHGEFPVEVRVSTTDRAAPHVELTHGTRDGATGRIHLPGGADDHAAALRRRAVVVRLPGHGRPRVQAPPPERRGGGPLPRGVPGAPRGGA